MSYAILEINDAGLTLLNGERQLTEIGCAELVNVGSKTKPQWQLQFGEQALLQAKLQPLNSFSHYWQRLGYEVVECDHPQVRHFADLAFLQLQQLFSRAGEIDELILLVPASFSPQQLSLLLGMLDACAVRVTALVDQALIYGLSVDVDVAQLAFVDMQLHQLLFSELHLNADISVTVSEAFSGYGLLDLTHQLAHWLNRQLIQHCRFDAFHAAETEQQVFNFVQQVLSAPQRDWHLDIAETQITVYRHDIQEQVVRFFQPLLLQLPQTQQLLLHSRLALLLEDIKPKNAQFTSGNALADTVARHYPAIVAAANSDEQGLVLVSRLAFAEPRNKVSASRVNASHVLLAEHAYAISDRVYLSANGTTILTERHNADAAIVRDGDMHVLEVYHRAAVTVNGEPVFTRQQVYCGDRLQLLDSGAQLLLIQVYDGMPGHGE